MTSPNGSGSDSIKIENSPKAALTSGLPGDGLSHLGYPGMGSHIWVTRGWVDSGHATML